jgi:hypothetical protein
MAAHETDPSQHHSRRPQAAQRLRGLSVITATLEEFSERLKELLAEPGNCACPKCGGDMHATYGVAGGGPGPYVFCRGCGDILLKAFDKTPEAPA